MPKLQMINCVACHKSLEVKSTASDAKLPEGWHFKQGRGYCSEDCAKHGPAQRIRPTLATSYGQWGKKTAPQYITGFHAAMGGFDVLNDDKDYVEGHKFGMAMREGVGEKFKS